MNYRCKAFIKGLFRKKKGGPQEGRKTPHSGTPECEAT